jgi:hypothetical protein
MSTPGFRLSRRAVLRGLGVSMALPALEIMQPRSKALAQAAKPLRFACVYIPNGFVMSKMKPGGTGAAYTLPPLLAALQPYRSDVSMISGLGSYPASLSTAFGGSHTRACAAMLTQTPVGFRSAGVMNGISLDQIIANKIKDQTKFPSLQVGGRASSPSGNCEDQFSCAYNNNITWSGPTTFLPKQVNPKDVFNRLFGNGAPTQPMPMPGPTLPNKNAIYQKSILDLVRTRGDALRARLGKTDKAKLDEYFNAVREVETRIDNAIKMPGTSAPVMCTPGAPPPDVTAAMPFGMHLDLLSDLIALAFQCDVTRVATYMYEHSFSDTRSFSFLPGVTGRHHSITHLTTAAGVVQEEKINLFYIDRFAYLLGKLKAAKDADGSSVLDNSIIYFTSEFGDAHGHNMRDLPVVVAGKGGGKLKAGIHVNYPLDPAPGTGVDGKGNPNDTQLAALHLSTLQAFGMNMPSFGTDDKGMPIATKHLSEIMA